MLCPASSASGVTEPSGLVTVRFVQETDWLAVSVIVATWRTVDPSSGGEETRVGAVAAMPPPPPDGGATIGVWFAAEKVNGAVLLPAESCSAFSAGTAYFTTTCSLLVTG